MVWSLLIQDVKGNSRRGIPVRNGRVRNTIHLELAPSKNEAFHDILKTLFSSVRFVSLLANRSRARMIAGLPERIAP